MRRRRLKQHLANLQASLSSSLANLQHAPAPETLHDLRVALRRLRTVLQPLARDPGVAPLHALSGKVLAATAPLRDLQVLAADLASHRRGPAARQRRDALQQGLLALLAGKPLARLEALLATDGPLLPAHALPSRRRVAKRSRQALDANRARLRRELDRDPPELHRLRLAVKRLRYQLEAETGLGEGKRAALAVLATAQQVLGDWHDRSVWLARAEGELDLAPCRRRWQREQAALAATLAPGLGHLRRALDALDSEALAAD